MLTHILMHCRTGVNCVTHGLSHCKLQTLQSAKQFTPSTCPLDEALAPVLTQPPNVSQSG